MKNFKKIICLCIALSLLVTTAFAYSTNTLSFLGITGEGISDVSPATREVLAYSLAGVLLPNTDCEPVDTAFSDVMADNKYSGYIKLVADRGIMNGSGDGLFNPEKTVGINEVSKTLVTLLGYDAVAQAKGGWPGGYLTVASALKLYRGVDTSKSELTYADLKTMMLNLLDCPMPEESIYTENGQVGVSISTKNGGLTYANKALDLYEYEAVIEDIDFENYKATVVFGEQEEGSKYSEGAQKTFDVSETLNIYELENIPLDIVIYDDSVIVDAALKDGYEMKYGVVDSVNNETKDISYGAKYINAITLLDDEEDYEFDNCIFMENGKKTTGSLKLMGKYVKIVAKDEEIIALSTWSLTDGGIVTKADPSYLYYKVGNDERRLMNINEAVEVHVIIDGEPRAYKELREGMIFSYYQNKTENILTIAATEKRMSDVLYGIDENQKIITIGSTDMYYTADVYTSTDNVMYEQGTDALLELCDHDVIAVFDIFGKVRYVNSYVAGNVSDAFYGYVVGYEDGKNAGLTTRERMRLIDVNTAGAPYKDFYLAKNVEYDGGLTGISDITSQLNQKPSFEAGKEVLPFYEFKFNSKGEITYISKLKEYEGFEGMRYGNDGSTEGSFIDNGNPFLVVNRKVIYIPKATPVYCIYDDGNDVTFEKNQYSQLVGKSFNGELWLKFYGYENKPDMNCVVMIGDMNVITGSRGAGVAEKVGKIIDAEGEEATVVTIDGKDYELILESSKEIPKKGDFVSYTVSLFNDKKISVNKATDLSTIASAPESWHNQTLGANVYAYGTVVKADKLKVILKVSDDCKLKGIPELTKGDEVCIYYDQERGVDHYSVNSKGELTTIAYYDIQPGMEIVMGVKENNSWGALISQIFTAID